MKRYSLSDTDAPVISASEQAEKSFGQPSFQHILAFGEHRPFSEANALPQLSVSAA
jgi:hypothetical protein